MATRFLEIPFVDLQFFDDFSSLSLFKHIDISFIYIISFDLYYFLCLHALRRKIFNSLSNRYLDNSLNQFEKSKSKISHRKSFEKPYFLFRFKIDLIFFFKVYIFHGTQKPNKIFEKLNDMMAINEKEREDVQIYRGVQSKSGELLLENLKRCVVIVGNLTKFLRFFSSI